MEFLYALAVSVLLCVLIGKWAATWNRRFWVWFFISFFLSPLIAAICLLIVGKRQWA